MSSTQVTLIGGTVALVSLDVPAARIVVTQVSGTPAEIYGTADGSLPVIPSSGVEVAGSQRTIPAVLGAQLVIVPPLATAPGLAGPTGRIIPTVRLLSNGTPTVLVEW